MENNIPKIAAGVIVALFWITLAHFTSFSVALFAALASIAIELQAIYRKLPTPTPTIK